MVPSVLIVDDEKHTREGLQQALQEHYDVSVAGSADEAFNLMEAQEFEVIITDLRMPGKSGLKVIDKALTLSNKPAVLMMTAYGNVESAVEAMKRGAVDFLTKPVDGSVLLARVQKALEQGLLLQKQAEAFQSIALRLAALTEREREVMKLAVAGLTNKEIAQRLGISYRTVEIHRTHVMHKSGATNLLELARIADTLESHQTQ